MSTNLHQRRPCRLCENVTYTPVYYLDDVEIVRCNNCGFIQIACKHSIMDLQNHYSIPPDKEDVVLPKFYRRRIIRTSKFRADYLQKYTGLKSGRILEIGSSRGHFLKELKQRGFDVTGVEPYPAALYAKEKGILVYNDLLENIDLPDAHFDAICMFQVLEHFEDPKQTLSLLHSKLKEGGYILLETPDIYSIGAKFEKMPYNLFNKEHISYFSADNLSSLLRSLGFSIIVSRHCDYDGFRMPCGKMIKKIIVPAINPNLQGPLDKILNKSIDIRHISAPAKKNVTIKPQKSRPFKDVKKLLVTPLNILFSHIAYMLDRGASLYSISKKVKQPL